MTTPRTPDRDLPDPSAESIYAEYRRRVAAGESVEFDEFCVQHAELADALRVLHSLGGGAPSPDDRTVPLPGEFPVAREMGEPAAIQAPEQIGPYRLLEKLGEGGMGAVYLAEQTAPIRRRVALKLIKLGMDTREVVARFEAERQALAMMDHPNIAKVFDAGSTDDGRPYFVMEYVPGEPITTYCDRHRLSTRERLDLFMEVCDAVQHAHQKAIIHRDLKPSNVLVMIQDGKPSPRIIDFGVAKATNQRLAEHTVFTEHGQMIGTPAYMSPEQAEMTTLDIDTRTDIYSLGVMLYELLVGALPFDLKKLRAAGYAEMQRIIREEETPKPSTRLGAPGEDWGAVARLRRTEVRRLLSDVRGDLDWITMKAMEKDRTRRYATASELKADLGRHLRDEPVSAGPPSIAYQLRKFVRKRRGPVTAAVAVVLALALGLVAALVFYAQARESALEATRSLDEATVRNYLAGIPAAKEFLEYHNFGAAREALEACPEKLRGWEWDHLNLKCHLHILSVQPHREEVTGIAWSPDDQHIASGARDGTVVVWDSRAGAKQRELGVSGATVTSLAWSPDGSKLAAAWNHDWLFIGSRVVVVSVADGTRQDWPVRPVGSLAWQPDGMRLAVAHTDGSVAILDPRSGRELHTVSLSAERLRWLAGGPESSALAFSADGELLIHSFGFETVVWETRNWDEVCTMGSFSLLALTSTGDVVGLANYAQEVRFVEPRTGRLKIRIKAYSSPAPLTNSPTVFDRLRSIFQCRGASRDGRSLACVLGGMVGVFDVASGGYAATLPGHSAGVTSVVFSPDGERVACGMGDGGVRVWARDTGGAVTRLSAAPGVVNIRASSSAGQPALGTRRGEIVVLDVDSGATVSSYRRPDDPTVSGSGLTAMALRPDGEQLATGSRVGTVVLSDPPTGRISGTLKGVVQARVSQLLYSPDGSRLGVVLDTGEDDIEAGGEAAVWDLGRTQMDWMIPSDSGRITALAFGPRGRYLLTGDDRGSLRIWSRNDRRPLDEFLGHRFRVRSVAFSPDGTRLVSASVDGTVRVWHRDSGACMLTFDKQVEQVTFSNDGRALIGLSGRTLWYWESQIDGARSRWRVGATPVRTPAIVRRTRKGHVSVEWRDGDVKIHLAPGQLAADELVECFSILSGRPLIAHTRVVDLLPLSIGTGIDDLAPADFCRVLWGHGVLLTTMALPNGMELLVLAPTPGGGMPSFDASWVRPVPARPPSPTPGEGDTGTAEKATAVSIIPGRIPLRDFAKFVEGYSGNSVELDERLKDRVIAVISRLENVDGELVWAILELHGVTKRDTRDSNGQRLTIIEPLPGR